jgi:hypothetical protein
MVFMVILVIMVIFLLAATLLMFVILRGTCRPCRGLADQLMVNEVLCIVYSIDVMLRNLLRQLICRQFFYLEELHLSKIDVAVFISHSVIEP